MTSSVFLLRAGLILALTTPACSGLARTDGARFPEPAPDAITFWGHACAYIDVGGVGVVTDPVFRSTLVSRYRRGPAPPPASYAAARVVLISHAHPDHLDVPTLQTFPAGTVVLCPVPAVEHTARSGLDVRAMRPGDVFAFDGGTVTAVVAFHMAGRWGLHAEADGGALGYVIETSDDVIYYSGDSNYFSGFADVGWTFDPDIVLLNINGHLTGTDAVRAAWATRARVVIPLHWGTYPYWVLGGNRRPRSEAMLTGLLDGRLRLLEVGEAYPLDEISHSRHALP